MTRFAPLARLPWPARWAVRILLVLLVLALVLVFYVTWTVRRSFPTLDGRLQVKGLSKDVTVYRDRWGVPQVYADTAEDLMRGQGYIHAQDRFWEMDFRRHVTAGRLSELFGTTTLDTDKVVRTLGWRRVAEQELQLVSPDTRRYLEAYAQGVNAWLAAHKNTTTASLEYAVLGLQHSGYQPEPWTPVDSLAWFKALAWDLRTNLDDELGRALAGTKVPAERVDQLYPGYPYDRHKPIVTGGSTKGGRFTGGGASPRGLSAALTGVVKALRGLPMLGGRERGLGSNSWVVAGSRTVTGKPLLANDPHLAAHMPSIWYQAGLHCRQVSRECPFDVTGFTFSGLPGVFIGYNDRIAWGFTNLGADVTDLYLERVTGESYEFRGKQEPLQTRVEEIKVAGAKPVRLTVRATRHGPLVSDVLKDARTAGGQSAVALRWTALDPGRSADALFLVDTARSWTDFRAGARSFEVPAQNLVYADVDGNIAYQTPGRIPVRAKGDGTRPVPGWTGEYEWKGFILFDQLPTVLNPKQGYIVTANNAAIGPDYPYLLTKDWAAGYRSARIDELVGGTQRMDVATMGKIQLDSRNGFAPTLVPQLLRVADAAPQGDNLRAAVGLVRGWDYTQPRDSAPAAYYNAVWRHLLLRTFNDELPVGARPDGGERWFEVVRALLDKPDDPWWDDAATKDRRETRDDMIRQAMSDAAGELRKKLDGDPRRWKWGDLHTLELTNDTFGTSGIAPIEWLFNRGPLRLGGGRSVVDATGWDAQKGYEVGTVPSMRMVADLADLDRSRWVNLTGASGHAFAGAYWDQAPLWARGDTIPMRARPESVRRESKHTLTLVPVR